MTALLELKQKIKNLYGEYEIYISYGSMQIWDIWNRLIIYSSF